MVIAATDLQVTADTIISRQLFYSTGNDNSIHNDRLIVSNHKSILPFFSVLTIYQIRSLFTSQLCVKAAQADCKCLECR